LLTKYYAGDKIKKNEIGGTRSTYGKTRGAYEVLVGKSDGMRTPVRPRLNGTIILKLMFKKWDAAHGLD